MREGNPKYSAGFIPTLHPSCLDQPTQWKTPRRVFVCSMSDLFHNKVPDSFIQQVFKVMTEKAPWHTYELLTKKTYRLKAVASSLPWTPNIWCGVTCGHPDSYERVEDLQGIDGPSIKWISAEPLLASLSGLPLDGIDWVVAGGESHPAWWKTRPMDEEWARELRDNCAARDIPFHMKEMGSYWAKKHGCKDMKAGLIDEFPVDMGIRDFP